MRSPPRRTAAVALAALSTDSLQRWCRPPVAVGGWEAEVVEERAYKVPLLVWPHRARERTPRATGPHTHTPREVPDASAQPWGRPPLTICGQVTLPALVWSQRRHHRCSSSTAPPNSHPSFRIRTRALLPKETPPESGWPPGVAQTCTATRGGTRVAAGRL
jgi:hypothetical protein